jgi:hypothetical protein
LGVSCLTNQIFNAWPLLGGHSDGVNNLVIGRWAFAFRVGSDCARASAVIPAKAAIQVRGASKTCEAEGDYLGADEVLFFSQSVHRLPLPPWQETAE